MKKRRDKMPSRLQIAAAWLKSTDPRDREVVYEFGSTAEECNQCWRCGGGPGCNGIERCHIVAHCSGGSVDPLNLVLLCRRCHERQPDGMDRETQLKWICRGDSLAEMEAACESIFTAAGTTSLEFVSTHGDKSVEVIREMYSRVMRLTAGPTNWKANLSELIRQGVSKFHDEQETND